MLKEVKGLSRTVGGSGVGLSSVRIGVRGGRANREFGGGLVTTGKTVGGYSEGHTREGGGGQGKHGGGGHILGTLNIGRAGVIGYGIGGTGS